MTTFTWRVTSLYTVPRTTPDYVVMANYLVVGVDGNYRGEITGTSKFEVISNQPNYIPYEDLTEAIVLGWIQSKPNLTVSTEACIQGQINSKINPPVVPKITPLPWNP